jgi:hypothetical protein
MEAEGSFRTPNYTASIPEHHRVYIRPNLLTIRFSPFQKSILLGLYFYFTEQTVLTLLRFSVSLKSFCGSGNDDKEKLFVQRLIPSCSPQSFVKLSLRFILTQLMCINKISLTCSAEGWNITDDSYADILSRSKCPVCKQNIYKVLKWRNKLIRYVLLLFLVTCY